MKNLESKFTMSYESLFQVSNIVCGMMERDRELMNQYGLSEQRIDAIVAQKDEFREFPVDEAFEVKVLTKSNQVKLARHELTGMIIRLQSYLLTELNPDEILSYFDDFRFKSNFTNKELTDKANRIFSFFSENPQRMSTSGITQEMLDALKAKLAQLAELNKDLTGIKSTRRTNTLMRTYKANQLYKSIRLVCDVGKFIWYEDPVHKEDYTISRYLPKRNTPANGDNQNQMAS